MIMKIIKNVVKGTLNYIREFTLLHPILVGIGIYFVISTKDQESKKKLNGLNHEYRKIKQVTYSFKTRGEAYTAIDGINDVICEYGYASLHDACELSGVKVDELNYILDEACHNPDLYGWTKEIDPLVKRNKDNGYSFTTPEFKEIDEEVSKDDTIHV